MVLTNQTQFNTLRNNCLFSLQKLLRKIKSKELTEDEGAIYFEISYRYRQLGICELFLEANIDQFRTFLAKSGQVRKYFLETSYQRKISDTLFHCTSLNTSVIDSIIASDLNTVCSIAELSNNKANLKYEYLDDFYRYHFLNQLVLKFVRKIPFDEQQLFYDWHEVVTDDSKNYLRISKALCMLDSDEFIDTLERLIITFLDTIGEWKKDFTFDPDVLLIESNIFMNGLAYLKLADFLNMGIEISHPILPDLARTKFNNFLPPSDSWNEFAK